ncbi:MAG: hypothetical protein ABFS17_00300 [Chloroflexota bacterium]
MAVKPKFKTWGAILLIVISSLACELGSTLLEATPPDASPILFQDDFSNAESGWERSAQGGRKDYYSGTYHINILSANMFSWSVAQQSMGDVVVAADAAYTGSAELAEMGVICRMQNSSDFYFFSIRSDGAYAIFKMYQGSEFFLGMDGYQFSPAINSGLNTNHIEARCVGDQLSLSVNGTQLAVVQDSSYQVGDLGLIVGAFDQPDVNVFFDNFIVSRPEG